MSFPRSITFHNIRRSASIGHPGRLAAAAPASPSLALTWFDPRDSIATVESWGFRARVGRHATDRLGYMAGGDRERAADLNAAIRDPEVRAILCLRGGCGSLRLLGDVDAKALRADPKPIIGFSDITALRQVWHQAAVPSVRGAVAGTRASTVRRLLVGERGDPVRSDHAQSGADLTTTGTASGPLVGGNLDTLARTVGVVDNELGGCPAAGDVPGGRSRDGRPRELDADAGTLTIAPLTA